MKAIDGPCQWDAIIPLISNTAELVFQKHAPGINNNKEEKCTLLHETRQFFIQVLFAHLFPFLHRCMPPRFS